MSETREARLEKALKNIAELSRDWLVRSVAEKALSTPPEATPEPPTPTLQTLAAGLGWGNNMTDEAIARAVLEREHLLRLAQELLETHKSDAGTAEDALRERIAALQEEPPTPEPERPAARCVWKEVDTAWGLRYACDAHPHVTMSRCGALIGNLHFCICDIIEPMDPKFRRILDRLAESTSRLAEIGNPDLAAARKEIALLREENLRMRDELRKIDAALQDPAANVFDTTASCITRLRREYVMCQKALQQIVDHDDLSESAYVRRYGVSIYDRPQADIARIALAGITHD